MQTPPLSEGLLLSLVMEVGVKNTIFNLAIKPFLNSVLWMTMLPIILRLVTNCSTCMRNMGTI